jgi:DNA topoisomerase-2
MTYIQVTIDQKSNRICVKNDGAQIPIKQYNHKYIPELIYGSLTPFDSKDLNLNSYKNGYGIKLSNIFSKIYNVEIADSKSSQIYKQTFMNNMNSISDPEIAKYNGENGFTSIIFEPDLAKFKMSHLDDGMTALMMKRVYDLAGILPASVKVYLNEEEIIVGGFEGYVNMFLDAEAVDKHKRSSVVFTKPHDKWHIGVALSKGVYQQVGYVNNICTFNGGTHVNYVTEKVVLNIQDILKNKHGLLNIEQFHIKSRLWIFVNCIIENPSYNSQARDCLTTMPSKFGSNFEFSEKFFKEVLSLGVVECLAEISNTETDSFEMAREKLKLTNQLINDEKVDLKLQGIQRFTDATDAGDNNSQNCVLILTDHISVKSSAMVGIDRTIFGIYALKGRLINVRASFAAKNEEIQNLIKILGLKTGENYTDTKSLRYGSIMLMADKDPSSSYFFKGEIINFLHYYWPSLIKINGFIKDFRPPTIKATNGNTELAFYSTEIYKQWHDSLGSNTKGWKIKHYKSLGTLTTKEIKEYFSSLDKHTTVFTYNGIADDEAINLAFSKEKTEERKQWLANFDPSSIVDSTNKGISYEEFINKEVILYPYMDNVRSIPNICDGLKPSERKILYTCFKRKLQDEIKVSHLAGYVTEHSAYKFGEANFTSTIITMAQNFVGSNNINLLNPIGQFGTRDEAGKDNAEAGSIFTNLNKITRSLYIEDDDSLMEAIIEEGQAVEPKWYLPIIPMILVNGADGLGTGWISSIPCYNPRDIVQNIKTKITTGEFKEMIPWYKGFQGRIEQNNKGGYTFTGKYEWVEKEGYVLLVITELPVKNWTESYKGYLERLTAPQVMNHLDNLSLHRPKALIEEFKECHTYNRVRFEIKLSNEYLQEYMNNEEKLIKTFKLQSTISPNLVLLGSDFKIKKYNSVVDILEEFYNIRLSYYEKRKNNLLTKSQQDYETLNNMVKFQSAVVNDELPIRQLDVKELLAILQKGKLYCDLDFAPMSRLKGQISDDNLSEADLLKEYEYLITLPVLSLTKQKVGEMAKIRDSKMAKFDSLKKTSAQELWASELDKFLVVLDVNLFNF